MAKSKTFASDECAQFLKAVGAAERLKIIGCLRDGPKNVSEISAADVEIVKVSHHLQVLRHARSRQRPQRRAVCDLHTQPGGL